MNENEVVTTVAEAKKEITPVAKTMNVPVVLGAAGVGLGTGIGLMILVPLAWKGLKKVFKKSKPVDQTEAEETEKDEDQDD